MSLLLLRDVAIAATSCISIVHNTYPVSDMLSFHNCYARRPLIK